MRKWPPFGMIRGALEEFCRRQTGHSDIFLYEGKRWWFQVTEKLTHLRLWQGDDKLYELRGFFFYRTIPIRQILTEFPSIGLFINSYINLLTGEGEKVNAP